MCCTFKIKHTHAVVVQCFSWLWFSFASGLLYLEKVSVILQLQELVIRRASNDKFCLQLNTDQTLCVYTIIHSFDLLVLSVGIDAKIAYNIYFLMTVYNNVPFVREFTVDNWKVALQFQNWRLVYSWGLIFSEVLWGGEGYISYIGPDTFLHTSFIINIEFFFYEFLFLKI